MYILENKKTNINNVHLYHRKLEKKKVDKSKEKKSIIITMAEISERKVENQSRKSEKPKPVLEQINKINKPINKKKKKRTKISNIRIERVDTTTQPTNIKMTIREYYEQLYGYRFDNLHALDQIFESNIYKNSHTNK